MKWIIREKNNEGNEFNAGSKARNDVNSIALSMEYSSLFVCCNEVEHKSFIMKLFEHLLKYKAWKKSTEKLKLGDELLIQLPVNNHTIFFKYVLRNLKKKGVYITGIIHDLESLRNMRKESRSFLAKKRLYMEEIAGLKCTDKLIVHNKKMKRIINSKYNIPNKKMIVLGIFDYLCSSKIEHKNSDITKPIIIAANLMPSKSGYVYSLPNDCDFNLYGANLDEKQLLHQRTHYLGKVDPDDLPNVLDGSFGLVWDGPDPANCSGPYGEYLKFNNPHKASLYLASGLPVIIWEQAAIADFIKKNNVGITVANLNEINRITHSISDKEYSRLVYNSMIIGNKLRSGYFLKTAIGIKVNR